MKNIVDVNVFDSLEELSGDLEQVSGLAFVLYDSMSHGLCAGETKHTAAADLLCCKLEEIKKNLNELLNNVTTSGNEVEEDV